MSQKTELVNHIVQGEVRGGQIATDSQEMSLWVLDSHPELYKIGS